MFELCEFDKIILNFSDTTILLNLQNATFVKLKRRI
jgi:hypothetical protein